MDHRPENPRTWKWMPIDEQRELFEEWKLFCIGILVSSTEGMNVSSIKDELEEQVGDGVPLQKMGFPSINHFLYEMGEYIEVRTMGGSSLSVNIIWRMVPENMIHVREMVLNDTKDRPTNCKKQGRHASVYTLIHNAPRRPSYNNQAQQYQYPRRPIDSPVYRTGNFNNGPRGGAATSDGGMKSLCPLTGTKKYVSSSPKLQKTQKVSYYVAPGSAGHVSLANPVTSTRNLVYDDYGDLVSQEPTKKPPPKKTFGGNYGRPRFLPGVDDERDTDGFDYCSGENAFSKLIVHCNGTARSFELAKGSTTTAQATASLQKVAAAPVGSSATTKATPIVYISSHTSKLSEAVAPTPSKPVRKSRIRIAIPTTPTKATPAQYVRIPVQKPVEGKKYPQPDITDGKKKPRKDAAACPKCTKKNAENTMDPQCYPGRIRMFKNIPEMTFPDLLRGGKKSEANNSLRSFLNAGLKGTALPFDC